MEVEIKQAKKAQINPCARNLMDTYVYLIMQTINHLPVDLAKIISGYLSWFIYVYQLDALEEDGTNSFLDMTKINIVGEPIKEKLPRCAVASESKFIIIDDYLVLWENLRKYGSCMCKDWIHILHNDGWTHPITKHGVNCDHHYLLSSHYQWIRNNNDCYEFVPFIDTMGHIDCQFSRISFTSKPLQFEMEKTLLAKMHQPRYGAILTYHQNKIFIIGGHHGWELPVKKKVECEYYDIQENKWFLLVSLPFGISGGKAFGQGEYLIIVDSINEKQEWNQNLILDIKENKWSLAPWMLPHSNIAAVYPLLYCFQFAVGYSNGKIWMYSFSGTYNHPSFFDAGWNWLLLQNHNLTNLSYL